MDPKVLLNFIWPKEWFIAVKNFEKFCKNLLIKYGICDVIDQLFIKWTNKTSNQWIDELWIWWINELFKWQINAMKHSPILVKISYFTLIYDSHATAAPHPSHTLMNSWV